ncbi:unnamed protein product [Pedinophyceae sp. YPF-701]|nr:unnamed protein product [Pedinophyceae sp. YPF-701]
MAFRHAVAKQQPRIPAKQKRRTFRLTVIAVGVAVVVWIVFHRAHGTAMHLPPALGHHAASDKDGTGDASGGTSEDWGGRDGGWGSEVVAGEEILAGGGGSAGEGALQSAGEEDFHESVEPGFPPPGDPPTDPTEHAEWEAIVKLARTSRDDMKKAIAKRGSDDCKKPRAITGYLDLSANGKDEFLYFAHASWKHITREPDATSSIDLVVFGRSEATAWVDGVCAVLDVNKDLREQRKAIPDLHACLFIPYPQDEVVRMRFDYPYGNSFHFLFDDRVEPFFKERYGWILRSDWDVFYAPPLVQLCPDTYMTGVGGYTDFSMGNDDDPNTAQRLAALAKHFGMRHAGIHNVGSTWFGRTEEVLVLGRMTYALMPHLLKYHFEQKDPSLGEGPLHLLDTIGWPRWYAGVTLLYAGELAANHLLDEFEKTGGMDANSHDAVPVHEVFTIHCWWTGERFSKAGFFQHKYDDFDMDVEALDTSVARDYCTEIALLAYRANTKIEAKREQALRKIVEQKSAVLA